MGTSSAISLALAFIERFNGHFFRDFSCSRVHWTLQWALLPGFYLFSRSLDASMGTSSAISLAIAFIGRFNGHFFGDFSCSRVHWMLQWVLLRRLLLLPRSLDASMGTSSAASLALAFIGCFNVHFFEDFSCSRVHWTLQWALFRRFLLLSRSLDASMGSSSAISLALAFIGLFKVDFIGHFPDAVAFHNKKEMVPDTNKGVRHHFFS
ncbi:hypothetical protein [Neobacillus kokaensis]|uniref:hypothetical protein n=1 Tax=Neobacillus kokaensis TaxID=2759023 RepID=UPI001CB915F7|nr:hypothetical protein [Neobacillus kokaensis]